MVRLVWIAALVIIGCKMLTGRWPWELLVTRNPVREEERKARALLGVGQNATREEILDAHRRLLAHVHPDKGGTNEQVHEANAARDVLLGAIAPR